MSLKKLIEKISKVDPCWTSNLHFSYGHNPVNKIVLKSNGEYRQNYLSIEEMLDKLDQGTFNLEKSKEQILDRLEEEESFSEQIQEDF